MELLYFSINATVIYARFLNYRIKLFGCLSQVLRCGLLPEGLVKSNLLLKKRDSLESGWVEWGEGMADMAAI